MPVSRPLRLGTGVWFPGAIATNPADQTVLVDTLALLPGTYLVSVQGAGSVAWTYDLQRRDSTNSVNQASQRRRPAAGNEDFICAGTFDLLTNERMRCVLQGAITGEVQLSIWMQPVQ